MKLKNKIWIAAFALMLGGCNYLDFDETDGLQTKADVYKYFGRTSNMLNHIYTFMPGDWWVSGDAMRDCATDDAEFANTYSAIQGFNNGAWSPLSTLDDRWNAFYSGIRAANAFIVDVKTVDFSRYKYDEAYEKWMIKLAFYENEARLLRAYYLFELARRYGDVPMPLTVLSAKEANYISKTPFEGVINFVVSECDAVMPNLPVTFSGLPDNDIGRVTKGFAMAVKTKALLYAASELHNPSKNRDKWKQVASAALVLIDSAEVRGWYRIESGKISANNNDSKETVLFRQYGNSSTFERINFPVRFTDGKSTTTGVCPSQNLVDAFETVNGYKVTLRSNGWECADPQFDPSRPYDNRDPRFARTIIADGMTFKGQVIESFKGGKDGGAVSAGGTATGYFLRKYIQESTDFDPNKLVVNKHTWVIYRYAEALLSYAEAMADAFGDPDYTDQTYPRSARWALNQVRTKSGGMPSVTTTDQAEFLDKVRNEWRVEFAFEGHRFWDVRRWKIGSQTQTELSGVSIEKAGTAKRYQREVYETRYWSDKMYLYPIAQAEIFKNSNLLPQNPGW